MSDAPAEDNPIINPIVNAAAFPIPVSTPVNGSVSGRVVDENNAPVSLAIVECAGVISSSDVDGFFNINNVTLDKYISTVKVTKDGYFKGYRSFCANASRNLVYIKLIPKILTSTINSTSAEAVILQNTTQINFQANSMVIKSSGAAYNGNVKVYASYIDPTGADISATVPGSFMGVDDTNLYSLKSTGMIAVELESEAGEALQLAAGVHATIKLFIPASISNEAPATIDTWSLDERGIWKKEATAQKSGSFYEMQVSHFSFWNCDQVVAAVYLTLHVQNGNGVLTNAITRLSVISSGWVASCYGITDLSGNVSGLVPASTPFELSILQNAYPCQYPLYTENIGPFTSNASLIISATLAASQNNLYTLGISGTANDCDGQPLQSGYALITNGPDYTYANVLNGQYTGFLSGCGTVNSVNVRVFDANSNAESPFSNYGVTGNSIVFPSITLTCASAMNIYDGVYSVESGWVTRYLSSGVPAGDALSGDLTGNPDVYMVTTGALTCGIPPPPGPGDLHFAAVSNASVAGIDGLEITVDGTNNTTITSASLANLANWPGHINTYDPATKTFHLSFTWINTAGAPREYEIVLKYKQPRS